MSSCTSLSSWRAWLGGISLPLAYENATLALLMESVAWWSLRAGTMVSSMSLSSWRAWLGGSTGPTSSGITSLALLMESVAWWLISSTKAAVDSVALLMESVAWWSRLSPNGVLRISLSSWRAWLGGDGTREHSLGCTSLSSWRAWIEIWLRAEMIRRFPVALLMESVD